MYDGFISYSHAADDLLAPRLQAGLQRFAKPWWKRRALRIFRDESSLSANPHLWSSITEALDASEWFVLLLSPDAAASEWVNQEIAYWVANRDPSKILPVLTDGSFGWADGDVSGDAVPHALRDVFAEEPRWVDLRFAKGEEQLDLSNPSFSAAVADVASAIHGIPKDELESEEVRQFRRTKRTALAAGALLLALALVAIWAGVVSASNAREAERQAALASEAAAAEAAARSDAEASALEATAAAERAQEAREAEAEQRVVAEENARVSRAEALAAHSAVQRGVNPELAMLLAMEAVELGATESGISALYAAYQANRTIAVFEPPEKGPFNLTTVGGLSPDGRRIALAQSFTDSLAVVNVDTGTTAWTYSTAGEVVKIMDATYTVDGEELVVYVMGDFTTGASRAAELRVFDAERGNHLRDIKLPVCSGITYYPGIAPPYYDLSKPILWVSDHDCDSFNTFGVSLGLLDPDTAEFTGLIDLNADGWTILSPPTIDAEARYMAGDQIGELDGFILDTSTGEVVYEYGGGTAVLSPDGTRLLARSDLEVPELQMWDWQNDQLVWRLDAQFIRVWFSADGSLVYGNSFDGSTYLIDAETGFEVMRLQGHDARPREVTMSLDGSRVATFADDGTARVWDVGSRYLSHGPRATTSSAGRDLVAGRPSAGGGLVSVWASGAVPGDSGWETALFDAGSLQAVERLQGGAAALSSDGALLAYRPTVFDDGSQSWIIDDVVVLDLTTGAEIGRLAVECQSMRSDGQTIAGPGCPRRNIAEYQRLWWTKFSPDKRFLAHLDGAVNTLTVWDLHTGEVLLHDEDNYRSIEFSPDSQYLWTQYRDDEAAVLRVYDTQDFSIFLEGQDWQGGGEMVFIGGRLFSLNGGGEIAELSVADLSVVREVEAHATPNNLVRNPAGTRLASSGADGVRVWDADDLTLVSELFTEDPPSGLVAFLDDTHLLVIARFGGEAVVVTLDSAELRSLARARVSRSFTVDECSVYRIDPCPTLEDLKEG